MNRQISKQIGQKTYIGIDNGPSGSIGILIPQASPVFLKTPILLQQDYTKKKKNISRLNVPKIETILNRIPHPCFAALERPFVNPKMFNATMSALRCLEAWLVLLETANIGYWFFDSKEWQKTLLPQGVKGTPELKHASMDIGKRLFPDCKIMIERHKDADGLLLAAYARSLQL